VSAVQTSLNMDSYVRKLLLINAKRSIPRLRRSFVYLARCCSIAAGDVA
jgi:hypothetical protein